MFRDITPEAKAGLPRYKGDLELTNHSAGSITSQAYMKRWNRRNEVLADDGKRKAYDQFGFEGVEVADRSADYAQLAVQGPKALEVCQRLTPVVLGEIKYYGQRLLGLWILDLLYHFFTI